MSRLHVRPITAEETRPIRHVVLRSGRPIETTVFERDTEPTTFHAGVFSGDQLLGVATVHPQDLSGRETGGWRLRGMAILPADQKTGMGRGLLDFIVLEARSRGAKYLWCNARTTATGFYEKCGWAKLGEEFEIAGVGPHYVMVLDF